MMLLRWITWCNIKFIICICQYEVKRIVNRGWIFLSTLFYGAIPGNLQQMQQLSGCVHTAVTHYDTFSQSWRRLMLSLFTTLSLASDCLTGCMRKLYEEHALLSQYNKLRHGFAFWSRTDSSVRMSPFI